MISNEMNPNPTNKEARSGEKDYSKREIDVFFREIGERLSNQDKSLDRIEVQTTKTNGSVRFLQKVAWSLGGAIALLGWLLANNAVHIFK